MQGLAKSRTGLILFFYEIGQGLTIADFEFRPKFPQNDFHLSNCSLVLWTGAITKWRNTKDWKDTEQNPHHNTKANQQWFAQHQETSMHHTRAMSSPGHEIQIFFTSYLVLHFSEVWKYWIVWQSPDIVTLFPQSRTPCHSLLSSTQGYPTTLSSSIHWKQFFRLSRVLLDIYKWILKGAIKFVSVRLS